MNRASAWSLSLVVGALSLPSIARADLASDPRVDPRDGRLGGRSDVETDDPRPAADDPPRLVPIAIVDGYYAYHDEPPGSGIATLSSTASHHNEFALNLVAVGARIEHPRIVGELVLQVGTSVDALYYPTPSGTVASALRYIQVANIGYRSGDLTVVGGALQSPLGFESFVTSDNWCYTHALVADLMPYFVDGVRATLRLTPTLSASALVYNGWSGLGTLSATNTGLGNETPTMSGGAVVEWKPTDDILVRDAAHVGRETKGANDVRVVDTLVGSWKVLPRLTFAGELWGGREFRETSSINFAGKDSTYYGGVIWGRVAIGSATYIAARGEALRDDDRVLIGDGAYVGPPVGGHQWLAEATVTLGWQLHPNLLLRVEGVYRASEQPYYAAGSIAGHDDAKTSVTTAVGSAVFRY